MFRLEADRGGAGQGRIWLLSALVSVVTGAVLVRLVDWSMLWEAFRRADYGFLIDVGVLTFGTLFCRSRRLRALLERPGESASHGTYLRATALHQLFFVALPSGIGDASLPFIVRTHLRQSYGAAVRALIFSRIQDLVVVLALGIGAALTLIAPASITLLAGCASLIAVVTCLYWTAEFVDFFGKRAKFFVKKLRRRQGNEDSEPASTGSRAMAPLTRIRIGGWTVLSWTSAASALWFAFRTYGHTLAPADLAFVVFGLNVIGAAAIFTIAGLGVTESGLLGLLLILHWSFADAASAAISVRLSVLTINLIVPASIEGFSILSGLGKKRARPIA